MPIWTIRGSAPGVTTRWQLSSLLLRLLRCHVTEEVHGAQQFVIGCVISDACIRSRLGHKMAVVGKTLMATIAQGHHRILLKLTALEE